MLSYLSHCKHVKITQTQRKTKLYAAKKYKVIPCQILQQNKITDLVFDFFFFFFFEYRGRTESLFLSLFIFYYDLWLPLLLLTYLLNSLSQILPKWIIARICEFYHRSNSENWSLFSERNRCKQILRQPQNFLVLSKKYIWWDQQGLLAGLPFLLSPPSPWGGLPRLLSSGCKT